MPKLHLSFITICFFLSTTACTVLDNYMLGKDNTRPPSELKELINKVPTRLILNKKIGSNSRPIYYANKIYVVTPKGEIKVFDANNAKLKWAKKIPYKLNNNPVVADKFIILTSTDHKVLAVDSKNGHIVWSFNVQGEILADPLIHNSLIYVKTISGQLYALKLSDGKKMWSALHGAPHFILKASSAPVATTQYLLVGYSDGQLDAVDYKTGETLWQRSLAFGKGASDVEQLVDIDATPIVEGNTAYIGTYQGYVGAFSLNNAEWIWQRSASVYKNMTTDSNYLYFVDADDVVWCLRKSDGSVQWQQRDFMGHNLTSPIISSKFVIFADKTGFLHILDKRNGEVLSRTVLPNAVIFPPVLVSNHEVDVVTTNGKLLRYKVGA